jgi:hypothetical protein
MLLITCGEHARASPGGGQRRQAAALHMSGDAATWQAACEGPPKPRATSASCEAVRIPCAIRRGSLGSARGKFIRDLRKTSCHRIDSEAQEHSVGLRRSCFRCGRDEFHAALAALRRFDRDGLAGRSQAFSPGTACCAPTTAGRRDEFPPAPAALRRCDRDGLAGRSQASSPGTMYRAPTTAVRRGEFILDPQRSSSHTDSLAALLPY